jgi:hypothetical protein
MQFKTVAVQQENECNDNGEYDLVWRYLKTVSTVENT